MATLGQRIKQLRENKDMSQIELGKLINVGNTTVSQWQSDKRSPDVPTIKRLADIFGTSSDYLLGRTDDPDHSKPKDLPQTVAAYLPKGFEKLSPEAKKEVLEY